MLRGCELSVNTYLKPGRHAFNHRIQLEFKRAATGMFLCGHIQLTEMLREIHIALTSLFYTWVSISRETFC